MPKSYTKTKLANGLTVLLKEIHTTPLVSLWVWYRVGSRDETPPLTGISHLVEHMQFKGTRRFPADMMDKAVAREGGTRNAFTFLDWTTYFETMPADKVDLALRIEADRMQHSLFDPKELNSERTVVISEREGHENEPLFLLGEAVQHAAFRVHSYHHEVIGDMADLRTMRRDDLFRHYRKHYIPNNAILSVAGDFHTADMLRRIRRQFGAIPRAARPRKIESGGAGAEGRGPRPRGRPWRHLLPTGGVPVPAGIASGLLPPGRAGQSPGGPEQPEHVWGRWHLQQDLPVVSCPG